jgi:hypothetical protein
VKKKTRARVISATTAAKTFGSLIDQVRTERAEYIVERGGAPAVRIIPATANRCSVGEFIHFLRSIVRADEAYLKAIETGVSALNRPVVLENRWES